MGKKRKSIATSLDEVDRNMYASFCGAANSLSQLYTQAMNQQKLSFQAGERHGLEKLYQWIRRLQEGGSRVTTVDILNYIQNELDYCGEEPSMSPRAPIPQNSQPSTQFTNSSFSVSSASSGTAGRTSGGQGARSEHSNNQSKNLIFSNALSSPVRRSLQNYHIAQEGHYPAGGPSNGSRNEANFIQNQDRHANPPSSNDSSMDMHAD
ncbi:hypothetical protein HS088_TW04G01200 [Tripterygium wilfordii]|uniref:Holocarboxylase synthetase n=1 Tax=Tripterygium wilfordii TaxID=458696 RepID=A0A7J7DSY1_TRIWF|nr:uncharacterized protein LOC119997390 [Tripterygium wilfordii]XP_038700294.1 uncharacterized protein LOC119997390 [Tripterygium wilfordii]KAF5749236.1 hypothetical protein HS088_TW04G01200 [Tripterygium wilfordii]